MMTCICWNGVLFVTEIKRGGVDLFYQSKHANSLRCSRATRKYGICWDCAFVWSVMNP